jgi:hypothetical protein
MGKIWISTKWLSTCPGTRTRTIGRLLRDLYRALNNSRLISKTKRRDWEGRTGMISRIIATDKIRIISITRTITTTIKITNSRSIIRMMRIILLLISFLIIKGVSRGWVAEGSLCHRRKPESKGMAGVSPVAFTLVNL